MSQLIDEQNEKIVITGISGAFPKCDNVLELAEKLFEKKDLITDLPEINFSFGKLNSVRKFDASFFGITNEHAEYMDPLCRILLEKTYEAICDAGYNFLEFNNKKVAVFVANCTSDAEVESTFRTDVKGALICERAQSFLANRISYWLGVHGSSCTVNTACSSSLYALELAYRSMRRGDCEAALVGGSNLCLSPGMVDLYKHLGITSSRCRSFDEKAVGFCRSEAISVILLQKAKHARRIYAEVVNIRTNNDGYKKQSILFPSHRLQTQLINEVYEECRVPKSSLSWVEAHGTGTRVGDYQEMKSLETLCEGRVTPLFCGCVKSNLGHSEATSGLCSIAKVIVAGETGLIPPNLHYEQPQNGIDVLRNGKIKIITENTHWSGGYVAVNNFGIGGSNAHLLLKSYNKHSASASTKDDVPRLVTISGRTEEAVQHILTFLHSTKTNAQLVALLHQIFRIAIPNHEFRGYAILNGPDTNRIQRIENTKRPVWFVYPGMGSQWSSMGKDLMRLHRFENSILECHSILENYEFNLLDVITNDNAAILKNIVNCFVGITAIMIALTDVLMSCGIQPDGMVGHSFGEIACAYVDGCLDKKSVLLAAYYRGIASTKITTINGLMAVIGLGGEELQMWCPPAVEIVCRNSERNCTVAGPENEVKNLISRLESKNIFAREIFSSNIAYHSSYIRDMGSVYEQYMKEVIPNPKERSSKWISSCMADTTSNLAKFCSARYMAYNLTSPVLFENCLKHVPKNAIVIEIAPHSILKSILNEALHDDTIYVPLMNKHSTNILHNFLASMGTLYNNNVDLDVRLVYPPVTFPVDTGTPMISPLMKWNHSKDWYVPFEKSNLLSTMKNENRVLVNYEHETKRYLRDYFSDGENVYPPSGYLTIVWETLAKKKNVDYKNVSVVFSAVQIHKVVKAPSSGSLEFEVTITHQSGAFEVILQDQLVAEGFINAVDVDSHDSDAIVDEETTATVSSAEIYKELRIKGHSFDNVFRTISRCNVEADKGSIKCSQNWLVFLDGLLQFYYLRAVDYHRLSLINRINVLEINTEKHTRIENLRQEIPVRVNNNYLACGGVKISGVELISKRRRPTKMPALQSFKFTPYFNERVQSIENLIQIVTTIVLENNTTSRMNILEFVSRNSDILSFKIDENFQKLPYYKLSSTLVVQKSNHLETTIPSNFKIQNKIDNSTKNTHLAILNDEDVTTDTLEKVSDSLTPSGFIIAKMRNDMCTAIPEISRVKITGQFYTQNERIILWHKVQKETSVDHVDINSTGFHWIRTLQALLRRADSKRIILHSSCEISGLIGFYNCLRREACGNNLRCFLTIDSKCPPFSSEDEFYKKQIEFDMATNVYKDGQWGCYVPFTLDPAPKISVPFARLALVDNLENTLSWIFQTNDNLCDIDKSANQIIRLHYVTVPRNNLQLESISLNDSHTKNHAYVYEFSGKDSEGRNLMGISLHGAITNVLKRTDGVCWQIPEKWPLHEAVSLPLALVTAVSILEDGHFQKSRCVLVQNACSLNGHAILTVALYYKYTVFTVESNNQERMWVKKKFPDVRKSFCSGEYNILNELQEFTYGEGIDILAVTGTQNNIEYLLPSLGDNGSVFYVGPEDRSITKIFQNVIRTNRQFHCINAERIITTTKAIRILKTRIEEIIASGTIEPYPNSAPVVKTLQEFNRHEPKNGQKIILRVTPNDDGDDYSQKAIQKFTSSQDDCFIICGGLGGMGLELAGWLIDKGATKIVLVSRTGRYSGYKHRKLTHLRSRQGVAIVISTDDITTSEGVTDLLTRASKLSRVVGIFNTTLILKDNLFENQTENDFHLVAGSKAVATYLLDKLSRKLCPDLKYFVVFSSITCGYGNAGQSNYGYANSAMERICESRKRCNLPALAIEWAGVDDVGYMENVDRINVPAGTELQPIRSCLDILDRFLCQDDPIVASFVVSERDSVTESTNCGGIFKTVKKIVDKSEIQLTAESTLKDVGLDSIAVAEVKNLLEQECDTFMSVKEIYDLRLEELWKIEKLKKGYQLTVDITPRKMAILEEVYRNFFKMIIKRETRLKQTIITRLPSFLHNNSTLEVPISKERTIFLLPSVEGMTEIMQPLAKNIDFQALCIQYDARMSAVNEIARVILPLIEKRLLHSNESFHMLGYSYGGLIAMELCHELEKKGRTGHLYLVDSSPNIVKWISKTLYKDREYVTNTVAFVRALRPEIDIKKLEHQLSQKTDWTSTRALIRELLPKDVTPSKETLDAILDMLRRRNDNLESYDSVPRKSLISKVYFFRPEDDIFDISADHGLLEYCNSPVQEFSIPGNHFTALTSEKLAYYVRNLHKNQTFI